LKNFIDLAKISEGMIILDAMCGNGVLSKELSKLKIDLYLLDNSEFQLNLAKKAVGKANFFVGSIFKTPFEKEKFDRVFIRNGVYEIPKDKQIKLYKEVWRILNEKGLFLNWAPLLTKDNQKFFQSIQRKKDELAEFKELVKNRYLMNEEEFSEDIKKAGFSNLEFFNLGIKYNLSTKKWCEIDFKGDKGKLKELNEYIRGLYSKHFGIEVKDFGEDIHVVVPAMISIAIK
jgi:ubiquinone/menaquinone biosynthesis C-methylase UbiE